VVAAERCRGCRRGGALIRRVLVTGAAGFVGVNLVRGFAEAGWQVVATARRAPDRLTEAFLVSVADRVAWHLGDVTDAGWLEGLIAASAPGLVVHAAAMTPTPAVERESTRRVVDTNLVATLTVLEAVRAQATARLLFASSTGIYAGAALHAARREDERLAPHDLYALCKLASEQLVGAYATIHGSTAASVRIGSVYGPMERTSGSRSGLSVVASLVDAAVAGRSLRVSHPEVGRDLIHAFDLAQAFVRLAEAPRWRWRVYNLASPRPIAMAAALAELASLADLRWAESPVGEADLALTPQHHRDHVDVSRLRRDAGVTPAVGLREGLAHTVAWRRSASDHDRVVRFPFRPEHGHEPDAGPAR
jgi:UDP-glucose 4-epimerase